ncbi:MAG: DinB family protein [Pirellulaceae bacterium]
MSPRHACFISLRNAFYAVLLLGSLEMIPLTSSAVADDGDPVALIRSPEGIKVESMTGLSVLVVKGAEGKSPVMPRATMERLADPVATHAVNTMLRLQLPVDLDYVLDRLENEDAPTWKPFADSASPSANSMRIRSVGNVVSIRVDGVHIAIVLSSVKSIGSDLELIQGCDALLVDALVNVVDGQTQNVLALAKKAGAKCLVVSTETTIDGATKQPGNTLPLSATLPISAASNSEDDDPVRVIQLGSKPVELATELQELIKRKEISCRASQDVFAKLSADQMNFRPANGSHTPRWNAEHMMGRELLFFSQIYHAKDPSIPVMDLNPKQMPPDYQAKHPQWTGAEEARQMERVTAFTSRFAYLLNDLPLDKKAPSSRWTPRALLKQMDRHYNEHTANVTLKFKLPDWPAQ